MRRFRRDSAPKDDEDVFLLSEDEDLEAAHEDHHFEDINDYPYDATMHVRLVHRLAWSTG